MKKNTENTIIFIGLALPLIGFIIGKSCAEEPVPAPATEAQPAMLDVKIERPPGYRCGLPENDAEVLYACSIDDLVIKTNEGTVWVYNEKKLLFACSKCSNIRLAASHAHQIYVVSFVGDAKPASSFDMAMLELRRQNIDVMYKIVDISM